jgi:hypothetical protein
MATTYEDLIGSTVYDKKKEPIGKLEEFYVDDITEKPTWITVDTSSFGNDISFVPLAHARQAKDGLQVEVTKEQIKNAPQIEAQEKISDQQENKIYEYYNQILNSQSYDNTAQRDSDSSHSYSNREQSRADSAPRRSDQDSHMTDNNNETTTLRLKKYVITENVVFDIERDQDHDQERDR